MVQYLSSKKGKWVTPADQYMSRSAAEKDYRVRSYVLS